jgi:hypothetical protein
MNLEESDDDVDSIQFAEEQKMTPDELLGFSLLKITNILAREQNFLFDLFSLSKVKYVPVVSALSATFPAFEEYGFTNEDISEWQSQLSQPRQPFKDPKAEKRIQ